MYEHIPLENDPSVIDKKYLKNDWISEGFKAKCIQQGAFLLFLEVVGK